MVLDARQPRRASSRRFDSLEQEAYLSLWRTYDRLQAIEEELFSRWEMTAQQYNLLRILRATHPEPIPTLRINAKLVSRAPDVTRMLDRLEKRGLVTRLRSSVDRRAVLVGLTPAGLAILDEIAGPLQESHERQLGHLSAADLKTLTALLKQVRAPHEPDGSPWS